MVFEFTTSEIYYFLMFWQTCFAHSKGIQIQEELPSGTPSCGVPYNQHLSSESIYSTGVP
jgi:hypothetical protein